MKLKYTVLILLISFLSACENEVSNSGQTGRIFVTNERGNSVSVINGSSLEVEAIIDIGERPRGIGLSPDGNELYVAVSEENKIKVVDPSSLKIIREFEAGSDPETFAVHPNGNIYISNEDDAKATVFNPAGEQVAEIKVGLEPEGVAVSPDGKRVIVTSESTNMLHVITAASNTIESNILIGSRPRAATFTKAGDIAYATAEISGEVVKVDMNNAKVIKTGSTGDSKSKPKDVILSKDEKVIYVAGGRANKVLVMDADTLEIIKGIPVGKRVWGLAISKDGKRVVSTDGVSSTVSVIDTTKNEVIKTIEVGKFPWGVVIND